MNLMNRIAIAAAMGVNAFVKPKREKVVLSPEVQAAKIAECERKQIMKAAKRRWGYARCITNQPIKNHCKHAQL